ncbi:hypothetical protein Tco_0850566 [Tanacetum coccineum]
MVKRWGKSKLKGTKDNSRSLLQDGRARIVIQAFLIKEAHIDSKKAQGCVVFTLQVLLEKAQGVTITDCHAGNPCVHICDPMAIINLAMIGGMDGRDCQELVTDFRPRTFPKGYK